MNRKQLLRVVAVGSCLSGVGLLARPTMAAYRECVVQGGYHYYDISCPNAPNPDGSYKPCVGTTCGRQRWAKGDYCTDSERRVFCLASTQDTPEEQTTSQCMSVPLAPGSHNPTYDCACQWDDSLARPWTPTGANHSQGTCMTIE